MSYLTSEKLVQPPSPQGEQPLGISHIIPGVLYPAVDGKLLDGSTATSAVTAGPNGSIIASSRYGTVQSDGRMYYYTGIKGSQPIKDPRIGAHFGSQRHKFRNLQVREQESGTMGSFGAPGTNVGKVYSVDGRDWIRAVSGSADWVQVNDASNGNCIYSSGNLNSFIEITGYFNDINISGRTEANRTVVMRWDDGPKSSAIGTCVSGSPLLGRCVDAGSFSNPNWNEGVQLEHPDLGIHTVRLYNGVTADDFIYFGVELISQDTGSNTGSDLTPNNSCTSMGSLTEADATTGWTNNNLGTFASDNTPAGAPDDWGVGSHSLHLIASSNGQWAGNSSAITTVIGTRYKVTFYYKVTNGSSINRMSLYIGTSQGSGNVAQVNTAEDADWHKSSLVFTATATTFWFTFQESASGDAVDIYLAGIQLFALSNTEANHIQIPSQNVISFGKKRTVAGTSHYDPFNGFVNSTSLHSDFVDTATSIGLGTAPGNSVAWAISATNNIRPYNGGRVVKWVGKDGAINTSVNMMPPNAQTGVHVSGAGTTEVTTPSATNTTPYPIYSDDSVDHGQSEIAKTFNWREFGNGSGNTNTAGAYQDASKLDDNSRKGTYVMDDGLTSFMFDDCYYQDSVAPDYLRPSNAQSPDGYFLTFIGTGFTLHTTTDQLDLAQNLPYGTHILHIHGNLGTTDVRNMILDGTTIFTGHTNSNDFPPGKLYIQWASIYQPKPPPIPKDAVVLADYMLMADFVIQGWNSANIGLVSKGVRRVDSSRDHFYDGSASHTIEYANADAVISSASGIRFLGTNHASLKVQLPAFCTNMVWKGVDIASRYQGYKIDGRTVAGTVVHTGTNQGAFYNNSANITTIGNHTHQLSGPAQNSGGPYTDCTDVVCMTHTSSHYQAFETETQHEFVGGDRNMEQTNLVVTPDGKTWEEVTRDTSYIGDQVLACGELGANITVTQVLAKISDYRGALALGSRWNCIQKDSIAIGFNTFIVLKDGIYQWDMSFRGASSPGTKGRLTLNIRSYSDTQNLYFGQVDYDRVGTQTFPPIHCKRGDYLYLMNESGNYNGSVDMGLKINITKLSN